MKESTNPYYSILKIKKPRAKGTVSGAEIRIWRAISANVERLDQAMMCRDDMGIHKASFALSQLLGTWLRLCQASELEARVTILEAKLEQQQPVSTTSRRLAR
jgi:hypothetical protein